MYYKKKGFPEIGDILFCTVKRILPNSIFVILDEYENKEGMIKIDEIAPGRIRNIRDYVKEGKKIVCKVIRISKDTGYIDLSLRRVQLGIKMSKINEIKQEEKAEKLLESIAKNMKIDVKEIYKNIGDKIIAKYSLLYPGLQEISVNEKIIKELEINKNYELVLLKTIKDKIKPLEIKLKATINLKSEANDGIKKIKDILKKIKAFANKNKYNILLNYISAPKYRVTITSNDYKDAEKILNNLTNETLKLAKMINIESSIMKDG